MPPSTWIQISLPAFFTISRVRRILGTTLERNSCPPKPGATVMISTMSNSVMKSANGSIGVCGRSPIAARDPSARISRAVRIGARDASTWKVTDSHPRSA